MSQYISELNATGTLWAFQLGYFGFVPLGILFASFLIAAEPLVTVWGASRFGWWLLWSQPIAFIVTVLAPCDLGCPIEGTTTQAVHDLVGLITYFAGALGTYLLSFASSLQNHFLARNFLRFSGVAFLVLFVVMLSPSVSDVRGLLQRVADILLAGSLLTITYHMLTPDNIFRPFRGSA
jgi:hypothetical protein